MSMFQPSIKSAHRLKVTLVWSYMHALDQYPNMANVRNPALLLSST